MAFPSAAAAPTATAFATSVTSMPVSMPSSIASGDLLIALVHVRNAGTWTNASGWTDISTLSQTGGGTVGKLNGFYKIAAGTESGTTPTWTASTGTTGEWQVYRVTGWHGTTPPEAGTTSGDTTAANPPSLTPSWGADDTLWLAVAGHSAASTTAWSAGPSSYSGFQVNGASSGGSAVSIASAYRQLNASSEDPGAFTVSGSNRFWSAATVAIRPAAAGGVSVIPDVASLTTTTYAPTVTATNNQTVVPGSAALSISAFAPTVATSNNQTVIPDTASLSTTTYAPTITITDNKIVTPGVATLTLTTYQPTVTATANVSVSPDVASLTLTTYAPIVSAGGSASVTPGIASLSITTYAPTVNATDNKTVTPGNASLTISTYTPTVAATSNVFVTPNNTTLVITSFAPTVAATSNVLVTPGIANLVIATYAPIVSVITPSIDSPIINAIEVTQDGPIALSVAKEAPVSIEAKQQKTDISISRKQTVVTVTKGATISI